MTTDSSKGKIATIKRQFYLRSVITASLVTIIVIFSTLIAYKIPWIYDMTSGKIFTLSDQTKQVLASLNTPVEIVAVYPKGGADPLISSLLAEYGKSSKFLSVEYIDAEKDPTRLASFNPGVNAIQYGTILVRANEKNKFIFSTDLFQATSDGNAFWGESQITGAIRYVTADVLPVVYFLEGHDESSITAELTQVRSSLEMNIYQVKTLSLVKSGEVPSDAAMVIITSPKRDLSEVEFGIMADYVQKGGKILFLVDVMSTNTMVLPKFNMLLHAFGIDITNNLMIEEDPYSHVTDNNLYIIPGYAYHPITSELAESKRYVILPVVMGLHTLDYDKNAVTLEPLLASSPRSWMRTDLTLSSSSKTEMDVQGPVPLAYAATMADSGFGKGDSRVVVIGNATFINNDNLDAYANRDFFLNCVNWLSGGRGESSISPRLIGADKLIVRGDNFVRLLIICLVVMPLIPFLCALFVWYFRRNQ